MKYEDYTKAEKAIKGFIDGLIGNEGIGKGRLENLEMLFMENRKEILGLKRETPSLEENKKI